MKVILVLLTLTDVDAMDTMFHTIGRAVGLIRCLSVKCTNGTDFIIEGMFDDVALKDDDTLVIKFRYRDWFNDADITRYQERYPLLDNASLGLVKHNKCITIVHVQAYCEIL